MSTSNGDPSSSTSGSSSSQTILTHPRHAYTRSILGEELFGKIASSKILVVGAGGIGCELLKNLVLLGCGKVELVDLDTIDLSNLNRQFLFTKAHISKSKALIASTTAGNFNPLVEIKPYHSNIKDTSKFGWEFFAQFDAVCNALDNLDARRWVNRMCIMTGIPLVESGTTGFLGQVQPILKGVTECYDCTTKPTPRTYPVCTIRSTPSTPIHCIVWAKTWLLVQLFGAEDENEDAELDKALQDGENADQIANLRKEAKEMGTLRSAIAGIAEHPSEEQERDICRRTFDKIFCGDVERLLRMDDMWRNRTRPIPIKYDEATNKEEGEEEEKGATTTSSTSNGSGGSTSALRDQQLLTIRQTVQLFDESLLALAHRIRRRPGEPIAFDKDDIDTLNFVTATSNLRSQIYHIPMQTRFTVKEMAGNIIPAIASTNAIIAGAQVFQLLQALRHAWTETRFISLNKMNSSRLVTSFACGKPNPECAVCQDDYVRATINVDTVTLGQFKAALLQNREGGGLGYEVEGLEIFEGQRLLFDEDFDDNADQTLKQLGIEDGKIITCVDEDGVRASVHVVVTATSAKNEASQVVDFGPADKLPTLHDKAKVVKPANESEDDDDIVELTEKPAPVTSGAAAAAAQTKRKRPAEEEDSSSQAEESSKRKKAPIEERNGGGDREEEAIELD